MSRFRFAAEAAPLADVSLETRGGGSARLSAWRGRTVLVNLWASWCAPCREELPTLARMQERLRGEEIAALAVSIDKAPSDAERFVSSLGLERLDVRFDPRGDAARGLAARGVPVSILVDRHGREIGRLEGTADWSSDEAILLLRAAASGRLD